MNYRAPSWWPTWAGPWCSRARAPAAARASRSGRPTPGCTCPRRRAAAPRAPPAAGSAAGSRSASSPAGTAARSRPASLRTYRLAY